MSSRLCVVLNGAHAANVELRGRRAALGYRREYIRQSSTPLSARFPLSNREVRGEEVRRWLLNLLPDDDNVLNYRTHVKPSASPNRRSMRIWAGPE